MTSRRVRERGSAAAGLSRLEHRSGARSVRLGPACGHAGALPVSSKSGLDRAPLLPAERHARGLLGRRKDGCLGIPRIRFFTRNSTLAPKIPGNVFPAWVLAFGTGRTTCYPSSTGSEVNSRTPIMTFPYRPAGKQARPISPSNLPAPEGGGSKGRGGQRSVSEILHRLGRQLVSAS